MKTVEVAALADFVREAQATTGKLLAVADIGASTVRFAVVTDVKHGQEVRFAKFAGVRSVSGLLKALNVIQAALGDAVCSRIAAGCVAVPGPVAQGKAVIANYKALTTEGRTIDVEALPAKLFPPGHRVMLNDVEAAGYGVIGLNAVGDLDVFRMLWASKQTPKKGVRLEKLPLGHVLVVAPGTGLGSCLINFREREASRYGVLPLEFGHTNAPQHEETALLQAYSDELGYQPEFDDLCTGRGLEYAYKFHANGKALTAPEICGLARKGDDTASLAMRTYHNFIMAFCSQLVMGLQPALVIICGDNVVNNAFYFDCERNVEAMRTQLLSHSMERMGFMSRPGVALVTEFINLNLIGCIYTAAQDAAKAGMKLSVSKL